MEKNSGWKKQWARSCESGKQRACFEVSEVFHLSEELVRKLTEKQLDGLSDARKDIG